MIHPKEENIYLGIVGAGAMGRGIAQIAAISGVNVRLFDVADGAAAIAKEFVGSMYQRAVVKGKMESCVAHEALDRITVVQKLSEFDGSNVVVEAIVENLKVKQDLFAQLEDIVESHCILATNTSSLSVTSIASNTRYPERVAGFHFFNPVPLMKLVEVIGGVRTDFQVIDFLKFLGNKFGHTAVVVADTPGFLVNYAGRGFITEAGRIHSEGIASFSDIDRVMVDCTSFKLGPFQLLDLTGLDVSHHVMELIYEQFYHEPRVRPNILTRQRLEGGLLGRKSGKGFYEYVEGKEVFIDDKAVSDVDPSLYPIWISHHNIEVRDALICLLDGTGAQVENTDIPSFNSLCFVTDMYSDVTEGSLNADLDPKRTVAIDGWFLQKTRVTLMKNPLTSEEYLSYALGLLARSKLNVTSVKDSLGFIAPRIIAVIINTACEIAQQRIATPEDIDSAVKIGLGYPFGPLDWGNQIGPSQVLLLLERLYKFYGDPRYRPSPWLRRRALLNTSLHTPD
jgi:3-hydroxybutyryl-CoA dehydrogenase